MKQINNLIIFTKIFIFNKTVFDTINNKYDFFLELKGVCKNDIKLNSFIVQVAYYKGDDFNSFEDSTIIQVNNIKYYINITLTDYIDINKIKPIEFDYIRYIPSAVYSTIIGMIISQL